MDAPPDEMLAEAARLWAIRVGDPAFADWDGFTAWLEADPAHHAAYDAALDDQAASDALFAVTPPPAWRPARVATPPRSPGWRVPAMAASVAVLAAAGGWLAFDRDASVQYVTAPGERREIALNDGSRIVLNGGTRLTLDPDRPRDVAMADGEALFEVRHDDRNPFVVTTADGTRLVDVGTVFNVGVKDGALDLGVSEGAVIYRARAGGGDVRVDAGEQLSRSSADAAPVKRRVDRDVVGGWRTGYLHYDEVALRKVATDLTRNLGVRVAIDGALAERRFSGTIALDGGADAVIARIGPILDVRVERRGGGWAMLPPDGARP